MSLSLEASKLLEHFYILETPDGDLPHYEIDTDNLKELTDFSWEELYSLIPTTPNRYLSWNEQEMRNFLFLMKLKLKSYGIESKYPKISFEDFFITSFLNAGMGILILKDLEKTNRVQVLNGKIQFNLNADIIRKPKENELFSLSRKRIRFYTEIPYKMCWIGGKEFAFYLKIPTLSLGGKQTLMEVLNVRTTLPD